MPSATPLYGKRLLPHLIDERAQSGYSRPYAHLAKAAQVEKGFREVTYQQLSNAINRVAHLLDEKLPANESGKKLTFGWMGPNSDLRYVILVLAAQKTDRVVFLPSPRNSLEAHLALLKNIDCKHFFVPSAAVPPIINTIVKEHPMEIFSVPAVEELLDTPAPAYEWTKTFEEVDQEPCLILHTSGSTGIPKPIILKYHWFTAVDGVHLLADHKDGPPAFVEQGPLTEYCPFPLFHAAGNLINVCASVYFERIMVLGASVPLTAEYADAVLRTVKPDSAFMPPSIVNDMMDEPEFRETIGKLKYCMWGGGPLPKESGKALCKITHAMNGYALTETSTFPWRLIDTEDWEYIYFNPDAGFEMREVGDNEYELVLTRKDEYKLVQGTFSTFPDLNEWSTKDLWNPHPTKANLWTHRGRADDIIVFSNGEKLNPSSMQKIIDGSPQIVDAFVIGQGRFQSALMVEPHKLTNDPKERAEIIEKLWPVIQEANASTVSHGRISKDFILLAEPNRPFLRASKGTVQKKATMKLYEKEIEALYAKEAHPSETDAGSTRMDVNDHNSIRDGLRAIISAQMGGSAPQDDVDLFSIGFDSLMAANVARSVNKAVGKDVLKPRMIYNNSTIAKLSDAIVSTHSNQPQLTREQRMQQLYDTLSVDLPISGRPALPASNFSVMLTGSTGSLGTYALASLLTNPAVSKVWCFNRSKDGEERTRRSFVEKGLDESLLDNAIFVKGDLSKPYFDLKLGQYIDMLHEITHILHNAWPVNFNMSIDSFKPHVVGVRHLIDFSTHSTYGARIFFTTTIGTALEYSTSSVGKGAETIPESPLFDWTTSQTMGYAESKQVSDALLAKAGEIAGVRATICRVGQVAGPVHHGAKGVWNKQEWFPTTIQASLLMGVLPATLGTMESVEWVPVDDLADVVVEEMLTDGGAAHNHGCTHVVHALNPHTATWNSLVPSVINYAPEGKKPKVVSLEDWVKHLNKVVADGGDLADPTVNPAVKLLGFYDGLLAAAQDHHTATFVTTETVKGSKRLEKLGPVKPEWMDLWLQQWAY